MMSVPRCVALFGAVCVVLTRASENTFRSSCTYVYTFFDVHALMLVDRLRSLCGYPASKRCCIYRSLSYVHVYFRSASERTQIGTSCRGRRCEVCLRQRYWNTRLPVGGERSYSIGWERGFFNHEAYRFPLHIQYFADSPHL